MGLRRKRRELIEQKADSAERDANPEQQWEYKVLNLNFKASIAFEDEFNKLGRKGWEFVAWVGRDDVARAIFKRRAH
jgi:hypothetical protein